MKRLLIILSLFLFVSGCSTSVSNKNNYNNQAESYAKSLFELTEGKTVSTDFYDNVNEFLDQPTTTKDEHRMNSLLVELHNLSSLYLAQETLHKKEAEETKRRMESIVDTLESDYGMNIK